ncbi:MAG: sulfatase-like hydrolase/transferase, partial [Gemmatimonadetes bacterium]|nr:sulfatase-like hydrolase/transferase [Gemmatimonadota bacterium]
GELLHDAGYHTYMTGKWHLDHDERNLPSGRGFERSFALVNGGASHWADQNALVPGSTTRYVEDGEIVAELPADFYSTTYYTDRVIEFISENAGDGSPFFAYMSYTAAHNPLHAPAEYIEKYRGRYDGGWDALAAERVERLRSLGLLADSHRAHPRPEWILAWDELTPVQQAARARDMEVYAAMIDYMDESIGRVVEYLRDIGEYDNTLIVFLSDNGPSRTTILDYLTLGGAAGDFFGQFDNSLDNKGLPNSSGDIGPVWAYAAAAPFRLFKGYVTQGGIQTPGIVKFPVSMPVHTGRSAVPIHVMDLLPTFLEVAGADFSDRYLGAKVAPQQGHSLVPLLQGESAPVFAERGLGWEAYGMDAFRRGDWKVLRLPEPYGNGAWQLYNLAEDPGEVTDLAGQRPDLVADLSQAWEQCAETSGVIRPDQPIAYAKPAAPGKY